MSYRASDAACPARNSLAINFTFHTLFIQACSYIRLSQANDEMILVSSFCFSTSGKNEAFTPFSANVWIFFIPNPNTLATLRYSSVNVVLNMGGSSEPRVTNRPSANRRGSGCSAMRGVTFRHKLLVGQTSSGIWRARRNKVVNRVNPGLFQDFGDRGCCALLLSLGKHGI